ncbi:YheT family hydrolase [Gloeocapsa sp. PCC 73106]|uniref:YheT family hydrolase n=1 Tax=Gloeocapsa sp. PCC 73106 TaxID=102232 RepID=UPI0002ACADCF|nr:alpha/beta fold hydrolase [Gloeocapsa sp. PCC 73106]ELR99032.1 putative hydrolase of the alpha/beta-hydrolase fold [Gloeocapsa sp. PCC 73106]
MQQTVYTPPALLKNGLALTVYTALRSKKDWEKTIIDPPVSYQEAIFTGENGVPIYGLVAIPENPRGTIIGTYGVTGDLENQWYLRLLGRKAFGQSYAVVLFDWRGHGKTAELSPTLTSDGLYEGDDFVQIADQAKKRGCPAPFWFTGYSLGGQLALWGIKAALGNPDIGGGAVICPSLDSDRSLDYLNRSKFGRYLEKGITFELKKLAQKINEIHPGTMNPEAIKRVKSIRDFDHELVIKNLGFTSTREYYQACNGLTILPHLQKPILIIYALDDPLFDPSIVPDLQQVSAGNPQIELRLTEYGGHAGYISSKQCQRLYQDSDRWWAWNRVLDWYNQRS